MTFCMVSMPVSKNPKKPKGKTSASAGASPLLCDGCLAAISSENDSLKCSICSVKLHRYCAGIPQRHYEAIASNFVCIPCSLTASKSVVAELRSEISALKAEVTELRSALVEEKKTSQMLATEIATSSRSDGTTNVTVRSSRSYASAARRNVQTRSGSENHAPRRRPRQAQRRPLPENTAASILQDSNDTGRSADNDTASASTRRETVSGARRVWGTLRSATCTTVKNSLSHLTNVNDFQVKRKFSHSTRSGKEKWWFIIKGAEEVMQSLESKWEPVKLQTGWQLEPCTKPVAASTTSATTPLTALQNAIPETPSASDPTQSATEPMHLTLTLF